MPLLGRATCAVCSEGEPLSSAIFVEKLNADVLKSTPDRGLVGLCNEETPINNLDAPDCGDATFEAAARSSALHRSIARAARIWALVIFLPIGLVFLIQYCIFYITTTTPVILQLLGGRSNWQTSRCGKSCRHYPGQAKDVRRPFLRVSNHYRT